MVSDPNKRKQNSQILTVFKLFVFGIPNPLIFYILLSTYLMLSKKKHVVCQSLVPIKAAPSAHSCYKSSDLRDDNHYSIFTMFHFSELWVD